MYEPKVLFDRINDEGDSSIYVGISYLRIVASQIDLVRQAEREALAFKGEFLFKWLNELRTFRDIIEMRSHLGYSEKEVDLDIYKSNGMELVKETKKIKERELYDLWFSEIEKMIERNMGVVSGQSNNPYFDIRYLNDKKIIIELSKCWRKLMIDANVKHLIMPEGMKDMKQLAKDEWIDRDAVKDFDKPFNEEF